jgi:hypothetical protein
VEQALARLDFEDATVMAMRRCSPAALRVWAVELEFGFIDDAVRLALAEVTGGWPILVDKADAEARSNARRVVAELEADLAARPRSCSRRWASPKGLGVDLHDIAFERMPFSPGGLRLTSQRLRSTTCNSQSESSGECRCRGGATPASAGDRGLPGVEGIVVHTGDEIGIDGGTCARHR